MKKYIERDYNVLSDTSKSTDASEAQRATQSLSNQESRETVNVSSERASEDGPFEYTRSDDATIEQRDSVTLRPTRVKRLPSKFQGYVLGFIAELLARAKRAQRGAPWVRKFGKLSI